MLVLPRPVFSGGIRAGKIRNSALCIVRTNMVHQFMQNTRRIVFHDVHNRIRKRLCCAALNKTQNGRGKGIIHYAVQLITKQIPPPFAVSKFRGSVFPHLAYDHGVFLFFLYGSSEFIQKNIRQFIRHIQSPAVCAGTKPFAQNAVFTAYIFAVSRIFLLHFREEFNAPPAFIAVWVIRKFIPTVIRTFLTVISAHTVIMGIHIKIFGIAAGMAENAVQDNGNAQFVRAAA